VISYEFKSHQKLTDYTILAKSAISSTVESLITLTLHGFIGITMRKIPLSKIQAGTLLALEYFVTWNIPQVLSDARVLFSLNYPYTIQIPYAREN
jgi:hypothetical protein